MAGVNNVPLYDVNMHINFDNCHSAIETFLKDRYRVAVQMEIDLHAASGCVCGPHVLIGTACTGGHCTVLARAIGHQTRRTTNELKKNAKVSKKQRLVQTLLRKKKTSVQYPIVIE